MQIQKDELRTEILEVAQREFVKRGFKGASMRVIAKKAHTTLGNLYNYFENKEAILDAVVGDMPMRIEKIIQEHREQPVRTIGLEEMGVQIEEHLSDAFGLDVLLSLPFVILMEGCEETKYAHYKEDFLGLVRIHLGEHLEGKEHKLLVDMMSHTFVQGILFIAKNKQSLEQGKKELIKSIQIMIHGILALQK